MQVNAGLQAIWDRQLPQLRERVALLSRAAETLAETRTIEPQLRAEALDIAHKLAGSLGMFGYHGATDAARAVELELDHQHSGLPQPERLEGHVKALKAALADEL